jgi:hypothetical protein
MERWRQDIGRTSKRAREEKEMITWSHTKIADYLQCPYKFYVKYIEKGVKQAETDAMRKGNRIHKTLENAVNQPDGIARNMADIEADKLIAIIPVLNKLKDLKATAELELGVRKDWSPCAFWDKNVWGRCKIDIIATDEYDRGIIVDWKTGAIKNIKYQTDAELRLHAIIAHAHFPELKLISGVYYYTQGFQFHPAPPAKPYIFKDMIAGRYQVNELMNRIEYAVANDKCGTRKNNLCPWCEVKKCKHYKPKEAK